MHPSQVQRVLITGASGFVGCHLVRALAGRGGTEVRGVSLHRSWPWNAGDLADRVPLEAIDLGDTARLTRLLTSFAPTHIYHLAGYAEVSRSFQEPKAAWRGNLGATQSLYDAVLAWGGKPRILFVGTGAVYGQPEDAGKPLTESSVLRPNSPYASSKAAADLLSFELTCSRGLDIVRVRPFNHVGPGQSRKYALASFAAQIAAIEKGLQPPVLKVGNLWTQRDLTDVRDVVTAYISLLDRAPKGSVFNIASGHTLPMQQYLDHLLSLARVAVRVETDPALVRAVETSAVHVDSSALRTLTGWQPRFTLAQTMADTLDFWRSCPASELG